MDTIPAVRRMPNPQYCRCGHVPRIPFAVLSLSLIMCACHPLHAGQFEKAITAGLSLAMGEDGGEFRPGFNIGLTGYTRPVKFFGIGGRAGYDRWSIPQPSDFIRNDHGSLHFISALVAARLLGPVDPSIRFFGEAGPGMLVGVARSYVSPAPLSDVNPYFGLSLGFGMDVKRLEVAPKYMAAFDRSGRRFHWIMLTAGFVSR